MADNEAKFKVTIVGDDSTGKAFASVENAFKMLGLNAEQVREQIKLLDETVKKDELPQHFRLAETELRRLGLTSEAVKKQMEELHKVIPDEDPKPHVSRYDRVINWLDRRGGKSEGGGEGGGEHRAAAEHHEGGGHEFEGVSAHINILRDHFGELRENIGETRESLVDMFPMLAGFGAIASAAGIVELVHATAEEQAQLQAMGKQLGVTADQLEAFHYAANIADVPVDVMDKSIAKLGITMQETVSGHDKLAAQMFAKMGISLRDAHGHLEPMTTILPEVAQALKNTADPQMRLFVATTLFGRAGRDMLPLLIQGREHLQDLTEEAEKLGPALTDLDRDHLEQFNDAWKQAEYVSQSFMTKLGADLAPVLTPVIDDFTKFVAANKDWIAADAAAAVEHFTHVVGEFDWADAAKNAEAFGRGVGSVASEINTLVNDLGGWEVVGAVFAGYKTISPFARMLADGLRLAAVIKGGIEDIGKNLPAALNVADAAWKAFADSGVGAFGAIKAASVAANEAFAQGPLGRTLSLSIEAYDAAQKFGQQRTNLNAAQEKIYESLHLKDGQFPTASDFKAINAARSPGAPELGAPLANFGKNLGLGWFPRWLFDGGKFGPEDLAPVDPAGAGGEASRSSQTTTRVMPQPGVRDSTITVNVQFQNAPTGMAVTTSSTGDVNHSVDVGYNRLGSSGPILGAAQW